MPVACFPLPCAHFPKQAQSAAPPGWYGEGQGTEGLPQNRILALLVKGVKAQFESELARLISRDFSWRKARFLGVAAAGGSGRVAAGDH